MRTHNNYHKFENMTTLYDASGRRYHMSVSENWCKDKTKINVFTVTHDYKDYDERMRDHGIT